MQSDHVSKDFPFIINILKSLSRLDTQIVNAEVQPV